VSECDGDASIMGRPGLLGAVVKWGKN